MRPMLLAGVGVALLTAVIGCGGSGDPTPRSDPGPAPAEPKADGPGVPAEPVHLPPKRQE